MLISPSPRHAAVEIGPPAGITGRLEAAGIHYANGQAGALVDLDLVADPGTITHVAVHSAADGSTLLGLLVGMYAPHAGSISLDGTDYRDLPPVTTRSLVALVLNDPWMMEGTIADNITFGDPAVSRERILTVARLACVDELAAQYPEGLDEPIDRAKLSAGDRRLIALARVLLRDPRVLLLEDPMGGLSAKDETRALKALRRAAKDRTTIVTSQTFDSSRSVADQLLRLEAGRVTDRDPYAAEVIAPPAADLRPAGVVDVGQELPGGYTAAGLLRRSVFTENWLAWHEQTADLVDLRVPRWASAIESARVELSAEFEIANRLDLPRLPRPLAADLDGPIPHTVYERVEGHLLVHLLSTRLAGTEILDPAQIGHDLATTLAEMHGRGYAHLDLGLDGIRISPDGAVVVDLKRAGPIGARLPRGGEPQRRGGVAPEQLAGEQIAPTMDAYALGALLYQLTTGRLLRRSERVSAEILDAAEIDDRLGSLIIDLTISTPQDRPAARVAADRLRPLLQSDPPDGSEDGDVQAVDELSDRRRTHLGTATEVASA